MSINMDDPGASVELMDRLKACRDVIQQSPSSLVVYRYEPPDDLFLLEFNPSAERILKRDLAGSIGTEFDEIWPEDYRARVKGKYLEAMKDHRTITLRDVQYDSGAVSKVFNIRAFPISDDRFGVMLEDVTDYWEEVEKRRRAYLQIERNIEHFAILIDEIRNPASVILHQASCCPKECADNITKQAEKIENIVTRLEKGWLDSEKVRSFLKRDMLEDEG